MADREAKAERQQRTVAALGYLFTPIVPLLMLVTDMKREPYLRKHAARALLSSVVLLIGLALVIFVMVQLLQQDFLWFCLLPVVMIAPFLPACFWARQVYLTGDTRPPLITPIADRLFSTADR